MQIHLRPDCLIHAFSETNISLAFSHKTLQINHPSKSLYLRLQRLIGYGSTDLYNETPEELPELFYLLETFQKESLLSYTIFNKKTPLATLTPYPHRSFQLTNQEIDPNTPFQISRFAYIHTSSEGLVIESPLLFASISLKDSEAILFFYALSKPKSLNIFIEEFSHLPKEVITELFSLFYQANLLNNADEKNSLTCWEFHDLLFHTQSRQKGQPYGATFRFLNTILPSPALPDSSTDLIALFKPDLDACIQSDPPFTKVLEQRTSLRDQKKDPITMEQLGEFLYRTARVKKINKEGLYETTQRPYPSGGACYELEIYPLVHHCQGLKSNLYRYVPDSHALELYKTTLENREKLLKAATHSMGKKDFPQILFLMTARFKRISWKYESMAYALILKNTGILMQTMYLTATAMKLSPCAIGGGNSDFFSEALGTDSHEETTVGEFVLGS